MRTLAIVLCTAALSSPVLAQPRGRPSRPGGGADSLEMVVKQAVEQLAAVRKTYERDIEVLRHLRVAETALTNAMQPTIALQKAYEEVVTAHGLEPDFAVARGVIRVERELESARRSAGTADFARLQSLVHNDAVEPASRLVVRNALRLEEEAVTWLRVQQFIGDHLRAISDISSQSLRAAD